MTWRGRRSITVQGYQYPREADWLRQALDRRLEVGFDSHRVVQNSIC